jgi:amino acid permease
MMWVRVLLLAGVLCGASHAIHVEHSGPALTLVHSKGTATASAGQRLQAKSVALPKKQDALRLKGGGEQKLLPLIIALFKAIVGSGILSLAYSVASWTDNPAMIAPVCVLTLLFAIMSGHCYALIGEVTLATGASSYQDAWAKSIDAKTAWIPGFTLLIKTLLTTIMYSIILGDLGYDLMKGLGVKGWFAERNNLLAFVSATVLLPLCLLRDFAMLSYTSILGVLGVLYTAAFMVLRFFQGSYSPGGEFWLVTPANSKPVFGKRFQGIKTLILMATLNSAYMTHYNAPRFFDLMRPRTLDHFRKLVFPAFLAAGFINVLVMTAGNAPVVLTQTHTHTHANTHTHTHTHTHTGHCVVAREQHHNLYKSAYVNIRQLPADVLSP